MLSRTVAQPPLSVDAINYRRMIYDFVDPALMVDWLCDKQGRIEGMHDDYLDLCVEIVKEDGDGILDDKGVMRGDDCERLILEAEEQVNKSTLRQWNSFLLHEIIIFFLRSEIESNIINSTSNGRWKRRKRKRKKKKKSHSAKG